MNPKKNYIYQKNYWESKRQLSSLIMNLLNVIAKKGLFVGFPYQITQVPQKNIYSFK